MTRLLLIAAVLVLVPLPAMGQQISLSRASLAPDGGSVLVNVGGDPRPEPALVENPAIWTVIARSPSAPVGDRVPVAKVATTQFYSTTGQVRLSFPTALADSVTEVDVFSLSGRPSKVTWRRRNVSPVTLGFFPAARRDRADVVVAGAWATGVDAQPLYSLDVFVAAPVRDFEFQALQWRFSLTSSLKTQASTQLDPDSFSVASRLATIFPADLAENGPYLDIQWDTVRFEFSRRDQATNFITAPVAIVSASALRKLRENRTVAAALDVDASLGLELGANLENKIVPDGYGAIVRFVPGIAAYAVFPGALGLDEIRWTSTYRGRILATEEPLIDLRGDLPLISIEKGVRHDWTDELLLRINPFVGFTIRHEYGSTPPAFRLLDHRATVGATVMWAWKR